MRYLLPGEVNSVNFRHDIDDLFVMRNRAARVKQAVFNWTDGRGSALEEVGKQYSFSGIRYRGLRGAHEASIRRGIDYCTRRTDSICRGARG